MRRVDLQHLVAGLVGAARRVTPHADEILHVGVGQGARYRVAVGGRQIAGRNQLPVVPVGAVVRAVLERLVAGQRPGFDRAVR